MLHISNKSGKRHSDINTGNKDDVNNGGSGSSSSIDESKLIGTWHFENASYQYCDSKIA